MSAGFCPQSRPDSCVAACCAMLLHHHRAQAETIEATHDRLHACFSPPVRPGLDAAPALVGATFESYDASDDHSFALLEALVACTWCAVVVQGGPWTHSLRYRKLNRPHGPLSTDPTRALPHHAVILTSWTPTSLFVHDPWFHMLDQPVRVEPAWLRRAWTGQVAYISP